MASVISFCNNAKALFQNLLKRQSPLFDYRMGGFFSNTAHPLQHDAMKVIQEAVSNNCVVIYSKSTCPYCKMAKDAFDDINVTYKAIELDQIENGSELRSALHQMTGANTVPRVFVNGTCIGGGTETRNLNQEGKLIQLVQQCNITAAQS